MDCLPHGYENCTECAPLYAEIARLTAAIAERDRIIAADDARLREAGERVGLYNGCDTADAMADRIEHLRSTITERDAEIERLRKTMTIVFDLDLARQAVADLLAELERRGE